MKKKALIAGLILVGCSDIKSSALNTSGIHANITAIVHGDQSIVEVILKAGGENSNTYVELEEGDTLTATDGAETMSLGHTQVGVFHSYNASFSSVAADTEFTVSLSRELEESAPSSIATLTEDFTLISPTDDSIHSRQDPLTISWEIEDETNEELNIKISGSCIFDITDSVPLTDGSYTINSSDFYATNSQAEAESCQTDVILERRRIGTLDPAFGSGLIYGGIRKTISIRLDP